MWSCLIKVNLEYNLRIKCNSNNDGISYSVLEIYLVSRVDTNCFTAGRFQPSILPDNNNRKREGKICESITFSQALGELPFQKRSREC